MLTLTSDGLGNDVSRLPRRPTGCEVGIPVVDAVADVLGRRADRIEEATENRLAGQDAETGFDQIQPDDSFGCEMKLQAGMHFNPGFDGRSRMSLGVVDNDVQLLAT